MLISWLGRSLRSISRGSLRVSHLAGSGNLWLLALGIGGLVLVPVRVQVRVRYSGA